MPSTRSERKKKSHADEPARVIRRVARAAKPAEPAAPVLREPRRRRALSHVGGKVAFEGGTPEEQKALEGALRVAPDEEATLAHVHGFHSYPARLHPDTARRLIDGLSKPGDLVLDSFCGSGTVLVEARLAGRRAVGIDVNPLAVELAWLKANGPGAEWVNQVAAGAHFAAEHADDRRLTKAGATHRYDEADVKLFAPHILLELDGLRDGIDQIDSPALHRALMLVLSAALTKVSKTSSDTNRYEAPKRVATGFAIKFFVQKAEDLARRLAAAGRMLPEKATTARLIHGDARDLHEVKPGSVDLVVSSPPYPGVYDYIVHHRDRLRWLRLEAERFEQFEIGARRHARSVAGSDALARFKKEFGAAMSEIGRVLSPRGRAVLIIADSVLGGRAVRADELVKELALGARLEIGCVASQLRPYFHAPTEEAFADSPRREHAVLLRPWSDRASGRTPTARAQRSR
jgi:DNA modification methylase